jgi:AraC family transcriptional activator of pobA
MKTSLPNYDGLYGDQHPAILPDFVHVERIETRSPRHKWTIRPHIHAQLFQLFSVETGSGTIHAEPGDVPFQGPCLLQIPDNTPHGFRFSADTTGRVLTLSSAFPQELARHLPFLDSPHSRLHVIDLRGEPARFAYLNTLLARLDEETTDKPPGHDTLVNALLTALLTDLFRYGGAHHRPATRSRGRSLALFQQFQQTIRRSRDPRKNIGQYAEELHITAVHLNRVCREVLEKPAMQVVYDFFLGEAQRYLLHTDFTVAEVAYRLNFSDPAYFSRLFKKHLGASPKDFRRTRVEP